MTGFKLECKEVVICKISKYVVKELPDSVLNLVFRLIQKQLQSCRSCSKYPKCRIVQLLTGALLASRAMTIWKRIDDAYTEALRECPQYTHLASAWETMYTFVRK